MKGTMKIIDEFQSVANAWSVIQEAMAISYAPEEGICAWWIKSSVGNGFKWPEFVVEALEFSKGWWLRREFDDMDWGCAYVHDEDKVDLGPFKFTMSFKQFMVYYSSLWRSEYNELPETVNVLGVDYEHICSDEFIVPPKYVPQTVWQNRSSVTFRDFMLGVPLDSHEQVRSRSDADKFLAYNNMRRMLFDGYNIYDETQREIIRRVLNNKDDFIRILRNL